MVTMWMRIETLRTSTENVDRTGLEKRPLYATALDRDDTALIVIQDSQNVR